MEDYILKVQSREKDDIIRSAIIVGIHDGLTQEEVAGKFGKKTNWMNYYLKKFGIVWKDETNLKLSRKKFMESQEAKFEEMVAQRVLQLTQEGGAYSDMELFEICKKRFPQMKIDFRESMYHILQEEFLGEENDKITARLHQEIDNSLGPKTMKLLLRRAVNEFIREPNSSMLNSINTILKDIESQKYKNVGLQDDGSMIFKFHMPKRQYHELMLGLEEFDFDHFVSYAVGQCLVNLKRKKRV